MLACAYQGKKEGKEEMVVWDGGGLMLGQAWGRVEICIKFHIDLLMNNLLNSFQRLWL